MRPYSHQGAWEGLPALVNQKDVIACKLYDDDGNPYDTVVEIEFNEFEVTVTNVLCSSPDGVKLNNAEDDIKAAIKENGYKNQIIEYATRTKG